MNINLYTQYKLDQKVITELTLNIIGSAFFQTQSDFV